MEERTHVVVKPDGVRRKLISTIISRFEENGLRIAGLKLVSSSAKVPTFRVCGRDDELKLLS